MGASLESLIPELQGPASDLLRVASSAGVFPRITSTRRTRSEQEKLYRRYVQGTSRFPAAPPGHSAHEYGYAFDMVVTGEENQADLGSVWHSWGGVWGANDPIHFEYPGFSPPATSEAHSTIRQQIEATVGDTILGFIPFVGIAQLADLFMSLFGVSRPVALQWLSSPLSTLRETSPEGFSAVEWFLSTVPQI